MSKCHHPGCEAETVLEGENAVPWCQVHLEAARARNLAAWEKNHAKDPEYNVIRVEFPRAEKTIDTPHN